MTYHRRIANITLHGVGDSTRTLDPGEERVWLSRGRLQEVLDLLVTFPTDRWSITVDDGNASDLSIIAPEMASRRMSGAFFVCAGRVGRPGFLDRGGVRELASMGMRIGSHGMDHVPWRGLRERAAHREFSEAKAKLEDLVGAAVVEAACPFGAYDRRVLAYLRACGFKRVYSSDGGGADPGAWFQPRTSIGPEDDAVSVRGLLHRAPRRKMLRELITLVKRWR